MTIEPGEIDLTDLDLFASGFPDEVFSRLRRESPVWWHEPTEHTPGGVGFWVVSTHDGAVEVMSEPETFSSERAPGHDGGGTLIEDLPYGTAAGVLLNMMDDPRHRSIRRLVTPAFSPRELGQLEAGLRDLTGRTLDAASEKGEFDFLREVAAELPMHATASLMGVPLEDRHDLVRWSNATLDHSGRELGQTSDAALEAAASMAGYGAQLMAAKRECPMEDILGMVAHGRIDSGEGSQDPVSELEQLMFFNLLSVAGSETTRNAMALGVAAFAAHPDEYRRLRERAQDQSAMAKATDEVLRWTSTTGYNRRTATRAADLLGSRVEAGDKVTVWWASANRDESIFVEPFRFDVGRDPNPHLAFGYRGHFCLGAALARLEIRILLEELASRFDEITLTAPIERFRTNKHAGVRSMRVVLRRG